MSLNGPRAASLNDAVEDLARVSRRLGADEDDCLGCRVLQTPQTHATVMSHLLCYRPASSLWQRLATKKVATHVLTGTLIAGFMLWVWLMLVVWCSNP